MTVAGSHIDPDVWVAWYDGYDKAVISWVLNHVKREARAVPAVFAAPERAFGQLAKVLTRRTGTAYTVETIPLPFMSLQRFHDRPDFGRRWSPWKIRKLQAISQSGEPLAGLMEDPPSTDRLDKWRSQLFPSPVIMPYQLDAWARNGRDLDLIYNAIIQALELGDMTYVAVRHPEPWNEQLRPLNYLGMTNNNKIEVEEGDERDLRYTFRFEIDGWVMKPSEDTKVVKAAMLDVQEMDTETQIELWDLYDVRVEA